MSVHKFYSTVTRTSHEQDPVAVRRVSAAVLRALRDRLTMDEADQLFAQLPRKLKAVLEGRRGSVARGTVADNLAEKISEKRGEKIKGSFLNIKDVASGAMIESMVPAPGSWPSSATSARARRAS